MIRSPSIKRLPDNCRDNVPQIFVALQSVGNLFIAGLRIIAALQEGLHFLSSYERFFYRMTPEQITHLVRQTLFTALEIASPFLLLALVIGFVIALLQAVTHMQEMTLSFIPKMVILAAALAIFFPWMLKILTKFTNNLLICQWEKVTAFTFYVQ